MATSYSSVNAALVPGAVGVTTSPPSRARHGEPERSSGLIAPPQSSPDRSIMQRLRPPPPPEERGQDEGGSSRASIGRSVDQRRPDVGRTKPRGGSDGSGPRSGPGDRADAGPRRRPGGSRRHGRRGPRADGGRHHVGRRSGRFRRGRSHGRARGGRTHRRGRRAPRGARHPRQQRGGQPQQQDLGDARRRLGLHAPPEPALDLSLHACRRPPHDAQALRSYRLHVVGCARRHAVDRVLSGRRRVLRVQGGRARLRARRRPRAGRPRHQRECGSARAHRHGARGHFPQEDERHRRVQQESHDSPPPARPAHRGGARRALPRLGRGELYHRPHPGRRGRPMMRMPLEDVRVLDLSHALAGPFCSTMLADFGAEVIKLEPRGGGDISRAWGTPLPGGETSYFVSLHRNKKGIEVDLKHAEGKELFFRLMERCDVVLENYRVGALARLGLGYEAAALRNPGIIYCSVSGFGQDGPYRDRAALDLILQAESGMISVTGEPGGHGVRCGVSIADMTAGMYAAYGIMLALRVKERTGRGQMVGAFLADGEQPEPMGTAYKALLPYQTFRTKTRDLALAVGSEKLWKDFCPLLG